MSKSLKWIGGMILVDLREGDFKQQSHTIAVRCDVDIAQVVATSYAYAKRSVQDLEWITNNVRLLSI